MKAREYAQEILELSSLIAQDADHKTNVVKMILSTASSILIECSDKAKRTKTDPATIAAFREGMTKWKAVVRSVYASEPHHMICDNTFGLFIAQKSPGLFWTLVHNNAFLGYTLSPAEQKIFDEFEEEQRRARVEKVLKQLNPIDALLAYHFMTGRL